MANDSGRLASMLGSRSALNADGRYSDGKGTAAVGHYQDTTSDDSTIKEDVQLANRMRELFHIARNERRTMVAEWRRWYQVLHNRTWGTGRDQWMPNPELPEIYPIVTSMVGWMTDQRPEFDVAPAAIPFSVDYGYYTGLADDLNAVLKSVWMNHDFDAAIETTLFDACSYGTGIMKTAWDPTLVDGLGDPTLLRVDPFTFYPDPRAKSMRDMNYCFEVKTLSVQEIDKRYPNSWAKLASQGFQDRTDEAPTRADTPTPSMPMANPGAISPATSPRYGLPGQTDRAEVTDIPGVTLLECWLREHEHTDDGTRENWRCIVVAGNFILMDCKAEEMWAHGQHPYERYVFVDEGEFWGTGMVELLASAQLSINRMLAAMEQNIWLMGNPVFKEDARSGLSRTKITNKPGQRLTVNNGAVAEWMTPPQMHPQLSSDLVRFYKGEMENISGLSAVTRGFTPSGRNSQGVMDSVQESAFVRVRLALRNLERALRGVGNKCASHICEFYDTPRVVAIAGQDGQKGALALKSEHFYTANRDGEPREPLRFQLLLDAGSSLSTSRQARSSEMQQLYALGIVDEEAVLEAMQIPNWTKIVARVREMKAANGTLGQPPGARQRAGH